MEQKFCYVRNPLTHQLTVGTQTLVMHLEAKITKVHSYQEQSYALLSSFKIMIIFNNTLAEIKNKVI